MRRRRRGNERFPFPAIHLCSMQNRLDEESDPILFFVLTSGRGRAPVRDTDARVRSQSDR